MSFVFLFASSLSYQRAVRKIAIRQNIYFLSFNFHGLECISLAKGHHRQDPSHHSRIPFTYGGSYLKGMMEPVRSMGFSMRQSCLSSASSEQVARASERAM